MCSADPRFYFVVAYCCKWFSKQERFKVIQYSKAGSNRKSYIWNEFDLSNWNQTFQTYLFPVYQCYCNSTFNLLLSLNYLLLHFELDPLYTSRGVTRGRGRGGRNLSSVLPLPAPPTMNFEGKKKYIGQKLVQNWNKLLSFNSLQYILLKDKLSFISLIILDSQDEWMKEETKK